MSSNSRYTQSFPGAGATIPADARGPVGGQIIRQPRTSGKSAHGHQASASLDGSSAQRKQPDHPAAGQPQTSQDAPSDNAPGGHPCDECERRFTRSHDLKRHIEGVHKGVKKHECPHCRKDFAQKSNKERHVKTCPMAQAASAAAASTQRDPIAPSRTSATSLSPSHVMGDSARPIAGRGQSRRAQMQTLVPTEELAGNADERRTAPAKFALVDEYGPRKLPRLVLSDDDPAPRVPVSLPPLWSLGLPGGPPPRDRERLVSMPAAQYSAARHPQAGASQSGPPLRLAGAPQLAPAYYRPRTTSLAGQDVGPRPNPPTHVRAGPPPAYGVPSAQKQAHPRIAHVQLARGYSAIP